MAFFAEREAAALSHPEVRWAAFCAVIRPDGHPRRPQGYVPLDEFWYRRGYERVPGLVDHIGWRDLDEERETPEADAVLDQAPAMSRVFTLAAAQYPIDRLLTWQAYKSKLAAGSRARRARAPSSWSFPSMAGWSWPRCSGREVERDLHRQLEAVAGLERQVADLHRDLARRTGVYILSGSAPAQAGDGRYHNRARLTSPEGREGVQDKVVMTRFEREQWGVSGGQISACSRPRSGASASRSATTSSSR